MKAGNKKRCFVILLVGIFLVILAWGIYSRGKKEEYSFKDNYRNDIAFQEWNGEVVGNSVRPLSVRYSTASAAEETISPEEFSMRAGASVRLNTVTGLRFRADVSVDLAERVAATDSASFGIVIAPEFYFEKAIELSDAENVDYVRALEALEEKYGAKPALVMEREPVKEEGYCFIQGSVANILYENTNLKFTAAAFIKEQSGNGEITYTYASYEEDVLSMGRSVFYVSEAALNDANANYSDGEKEILRGFIGRGIDYAAGLSEEESDSVSERELEIRWLKKPETTLNIGETFSLDVETAVRYGEETGAGYWLSIDVPVYWKSDNSSVIAVSRDGKITALQEGEANITACFGEITDFCEVVCAALPEYTCELVDTTPYGVLEIENPVSNVREGMPFETKIRVKDYERCGELSFWIDGEIYTTANGEITFSSTVSEDTVFEIKDVSSSLDYFSGYGANLSLDSTAKNLEKIILPTKTGDGKAVTRLSDRFFNGAAGTVLQKNLQEIIIPESYEKLPQTIFRNCSNLETIYLYNTNLSNMSGNSGNWSGCTALQSIYVPSEALEEYKVSSFWKVKTDCLKEIPIEKEK